MQTAVAD